MVQSQTTVGLLNTVSMPTGTASALGAYGNLVYLQQLQALQATSFVNGGWSGTTSSTTSNIVWFSIPTACTIPTALPPPPPPREPENFNRYINASDLMEDFIRFCGTEQVTKAEFMKLPLELFMKWLILEAAEVDGEPAPPDIKLVEDLRAKIASVRGAL